MSQLPSPYGGQNKMKLSKMEYVYGILGTIGILLTVFIYAFEVRHFSNTFGIKTLLIYSLLIGGVIGAIIAFFYSKRYSEPLEKFRVYLAFIFLGFAVSPLIASKTNRHLGISKLIPEEVIFEKQEAYSKSRFGKVPTEVDGYFLFFIKDNQIVRVKTKEKLSPMPSKGDTITVQFRSGFWGCNYFYE